MADINFSRYASLILKHNLDIYTRELTISGLITPRAYFRFDKQLRILETQSDPVKVYVNTEGGDIIDHFAIIDRIQNSKCHITTIGMGLVMSAGISILAAGDHRMSTKHTQFMHHGLLSTNGSHMKVPEMEIDIKYAKELDRKRFQFLAENSSKPYAFWASTGKHSDYYFDAEKALELGIIDEIITKGK